MARVTGLGGIFYKVADTAATQAWYQDNLGVGGEWGAMFPFKKDDPEGFTLLSPFKADSDYFGPSDEAFMINLRVDDLDGDDRRPGGQGHRDPRPAGRGLWPLRLDHRSRRGEDRAVAANWAGADRNDAASSRPSPRCTCPGDPVVLYNIWDVGSALAVVAAGAKALATGSHPVGDASGLWRRAPGAARLRASPMPRRIVDGGRRCR